MTTYLVIGSNSFTGATFVDHLLARGDDVIGVSRSAELAMPFRVYGWAARPGRWRFRQIDLNHDLDDLMELIDQTRPTHIANFAAQSMVGESWTNPDHWMMTNVVATGRLIERLRHLDHLERYVHVTTPEVYGSTSGLIDETHRFDPSTPYAVSRAAGDMSLTCYFRAYGFPVVFTRAANVYGAGQPLYRIAPRTVYFAKTGRRLQLHGGGRSTRSFIHARDVASATRAVAERGRLGETYHISTPHSLSIRELVERILAQLGVAFDGAVEIVGDRLGKDDAYGLDSAKLRETLGWRDEIGLDQGIAEISQWCDRWSDQLATASIDYVHKP